MCGDGDGKGELKRGAGSAGGDGPQPAAVRFDDGATDGQPHTGAGILGRKECREDLVLVIRR